MILGARGRRPVRGVGLRARGRRATSCSWSSRTRRAAPRARAPGPITPYPWGAHYVPVPTRRQPRPRGAARRGGRARGRDAAGKPVCAEAGPLPRAAGARSSTAAQWYEGLYPRDGASAERPAPAGRVRGGDAPLVAAGATPRAGAPSPSRARAARTRPRSRALDHLSMAECLDEHGWTSPRLRWLVEYACRDDYGATLAQTSAWAGVHYFAARARRRSPARRAELLTWPEGNGRLVAHLARTRGRRVRLGHAGHRRAARGRRGVEVVCARRGRARRRRCARATWSSPCPASSPRTSIAPTASAAAGLRETTYGSWMVANLTLRDRPASRGLPAGLGQRALRQPVARLRRGHPPDRPRPRADRLHLLPAARWTTTRAADRERLLRDAAATEWVDAILADLGRAHPGIRDLVERVDV